MHELVVNIFSPSRVIVKKSASSITVPSITGEIGILPGHAKMVSEISIGELKIDGDASQRFFVSGGYVDVKEDNVKVMVEVVERPEEISVERAKKSLERAKSRIEKPSDDFDLARALASIARATHRIEIAK